MSKEISKEMNKNKNKNTRCEKYREFFNEEYLMGPNSLQLLDEMLTKYPLKEGGRVLDLGAGRGITSMFMAKEANVDVFAAELWISPTENAKAFEKWGVADRVIPMKVDANEMPFAEDYFDAIVSIDAFHYFANKKNYFQDKILPYIKKGGVAIIAMPSLKKEIEGPIPELLLEWFEGDEGEMNLFHTREEWLEILGDNKGYEVVMDFDMECFDEAWNDWFESGHKYGIKDKEFFDRGLRDYLSFVGLVIRRKE